MEQRRDHKESSLLATTLAVSQNLEENIVFPHMPSNSILSRAFFKWCHTTRLAWCTTWLDTCIKTPSTTRFIAAAAVAFLFTTHVSPHIHAHAHPRPFLHHLNWIQRENTALRYSMLDLSFMNSTQCALNCADDHYHMYDAPLSVSKHTAQTDERNRSHAAWKKKKIRVQAIRK